MKTDEFRDKSINAIANVSALFPCRPFLQSIREQVISGNIQHVVIDNLQFVVGLATLHKENTSFMERLNLQAILYPPFYTFFMFRIVLWASSEAQPPILALILHWLFIQENLLQGFLQTTSILQVDESLDVQDVAGSARITQEADNLLVIQRRRDDVDKRKYRKFLYVSRPGSTQFLDPQKPLWPKTCRIGPTRIGFSTGDLHPYFG